MSRFHITKSGEPAACRATTRACPLGGQHFDSIEEAAMAVSEIEPGVRSALLHALSAEGVSVNEEHFMEGYGLSLSRQGREVACVTPKDGRWLLGTNDLDLNWRKIPRTIGSYATQEEALQAYADGRR